MLEHFSQFAIQIARLQKNLQRQSDFDQFCSVTWQPTIDVFEREDCLIIYVELPDVDRSTVKVTVADDTLKITGNRPKHIPECTVHVRHMEIPHGEFARLIPLPQGLNTGSISAEYKDHYLILAVPKVPGYGR